MPQIDVVLKFASLAAALADPTVQQHVTIDPNTQVVTVMLDHVIPNLQVWRTSQDVSSPVTDPQTGQTSQQITHTFLTGYYVLISLPQIVPALRDNAAVQVVINRDANTVIRRGTGITLSLLNDLQFSPIYAGANYPWGAW